MSQSKDAGQTHPVIPAVYRLHPATISSLALERFLGRQRRASARGRRSDGGAGTLHAVAGHPVADGPDAA